MPEFFKPKTINNNKTNNELSPSNKMAVQEITTIRGSIEGQNNAAATPVFQHTNG